MNHPINKLFDVLAPEAKLLLRGRPVSVNLCEELARMDAVRQGEVARLMVASGIFTARYARALVCATDHSLLARRKARPRSSIDPCWRTAASEEITAIAAQLRELSDITASDTILLLVYCQYVQRILANKRSRRYLERVCPQLCEQLQATVQSYWTSEFIQYGR
jgi:hypothetical protein